MYTWLETQLLPACLRGVSVGPVPSAARRRRATQQAQEARTGCDGADRCHVQCSDAELRAHARCGSRRGPRVAVQKLANDRQLWVHNMDLLKQYQSLNDDLHVDPNANFTRDVVKEGIFDARRQGLAAAAKKKKSKDASSTGSTSTATVAAASAAASLHECTQTTLIGARGSSAWAPTGLGERGCGWSVAAL